MKGKNATTSFLPKKKKGGQVRFSDKITHVPDKEKKCLTKVQAKHIYEIVEMNKPVNIHAKNQDIKDDSKIRIRSKEEKIDSDLNPYQIIILNNGPKDDAKTEQMIFSDKIKYVNSCVNMNPSLTIRPLEDKKHKRLYSSLKADEDLIPDIIFDEDRIRDTYLDKYDDVHAETSQATRFDESTDLSTTYLGKTNDARGCVIKVEERFPISGQGYTNGKIEAPFVDEISGLAIVKMLDRKEQCTVVLKLKFVRNCASLDTTNYTHEMVTFEPKMLGILDLRSLGYYKVKQGVLQQNLSKCYHFESVERLCEEFNTIVNERKKEEKEVEKDKYPWLDENDERKYMADREILEKHINLDDFMFDRIREDTSKGYDL